MTLIEAEERALKILKQVMEEKISSTNVEVCSMQNVYKIHFNVYTCFPDGISQSRWKI